MSRAIDTVLLDLGGVLIDVDYHRTAEAFNALGFDGFEAFYSKAQQDHLFDGFEVGALSPAEFRARIQGLHGGGITEKAISERQEQILYPPFGKRGGFRLGGEVPNRWRRYAVRQKLTARS